MQLAIGAEHEELISVIDNVLDVAALWKDVQRSPYGVPWPGICQGLPEIVDGHCNIAVHGCWDIRQDDFVDILVGAILKVMECRKGREMDLSSSERVDKTQIEAFVQDYKPSVLVSNEAVPAMDLREVGERVVSCFYGTEERELAPVIFLTAHQHEPRKVGSQGKGITQSRCP